MTQEETGVATPPQDSRAIARAQRPVVDPINRDHEIVVVARQVAGLPAERAEVERIEHVVTLPAAYQFQMGTVKVQRRKRGNDWEDVIDPETRRPVLDDTRKVGITSDGYLFLNRTLGLELVLADTVTGQDGKAYPNPIHQPMYAAIRGGIPYRSDFGQLLWTEETLEADYWQVYQDARINAYSARVRKVDGQIVTDDGGFPVFDLSDDDERSAARVLSALKASGLKRLQTSLFTRQLKVAIGIKSLPYKTVGNYDIRLVTFRDQLTTEERVERLMQTGGAIFGGTGIKRVLSPEEVEEAVRSDPDNEDAAFLGREEADRVEQSRGSAYEVRGAYSPEAEERAKVDPASIPGVQKGVKNVTPEPEAAAPQEAERPATGQEAEEAARAAEAKPIGAPWSPDELTDL